MKVKQTWPKVSIRTKIIGFIVACVAAAGAAAFGWFALHNAPYRNEVARYSREVGMVLDMAPETLKQFTTTADSKAHATALDALAVSFEQKAKEAPLAPHLLGVSFGVEAERTKVNRLQVAAAEVAKKLKEESAFIAYQAQLAHDLQALSLKDAANYEHIMALADEWQQVVLRLKQVAAPVKLVDVSATLLQKMAEVRDIMVQLADLHEAKNEKGFAAKYKELEVATASFKPLAEQVVQAAVALDNELAQAVATLRQNL